MYTAQQHYIDGQWVEPIGGRRFETIDPATEEPSGVVQLGSADDVDAAATAARKAFGSFSRTSRKERIELLESVIEAYAKRKDDLAEAITAEIGAPVTLARKLHASIGHIHLAIALKVLREFEFSKKRGASEIRFEPIGVCGLITPWNWPINQLAAKVAPALATGCTTVLKPSELSPYSAQIFAEVIEDAGVAPGVFNLVHGDGPTVGAAISRHPEIDMVSFTGSTNAGIEVAKAAAPTVKRVHQELGGKSANIILPDADVAKVAGDGFRAMVGNAGQSCNAPTRMFVPREKKQEALEALKQTAHALSVGAPASDPDYGPVVSAAQYQKIQDLIERGIGEGATLLTGGPGRPEGLNRGYFVRPTIFSDVTNDMTIAREEIFGPVLCVLEYDDLDEAIEVANDTPYGLAAYIQGKDEAVIADVASRLRAGQILINNPHPDGMAPFGGYKQSGNGREWGDFGFEAFLEVKALLGFSNPSQEKG